MAFLSVLEKMIISFGHSRAESHFDVANKKARRFEDIYTATRNAVEVYTTEKLGAYFA